jgi:hypothetical protein
VRTVLGKAPQDAPQQQEAAMSEIVRQKSQDLSTMESAYKMCQVLSKSDLVPKSYRGKPENVFLAYIAGQLFGWDVTMAMRSFHIIEGTPSLKPDKTQAIQPKLGTPSKTLSVPVF